MSAKNKEEGWHQDAGIFLAAENAFSDMTAHAEEIKQHAQIKEDQQRGALSKADPGILRKEAAGADGVEQGVHQQQGDTDYKEDAGHVQHHAADAHAAAPDKLGPGAEMLEGLHQRFILLSFDETVI